MNKILVPVDFTPSSRSASEYAAALARLFNAQVHLLHVYMEPAPTTEMPSAWIVTGSVLSEEIQKRMDSEVTHLKDATALNITGETTLGFVGDTIQEVATNIGADLIAMGMKKDNPGKLFGSATEVAIRKSSVPVLVVPEDTVFTPVKQMVFASDFVEVSNISCFNLLRQFVEKFQADLSLLHVRKDGTEFSSSEIPGRTQLGRVLNNLPGYRYEEVIDNDVQQGIQSFVEQNPTDLLVMIARPHNIFERWFGTIHTHSMSYLTNRPLLVLKDYE